LQQNTNIASIVHTKCAKIVDENRFVCSVVEVIVISSQHTDKRSSWFDRK